jgi:hypothetical protein
VSEPVISRNADLAWANALETAERALTTTNSHGDGDIAAAVAAAFASMAYDGDRFDLSWADLAHVAARERRQSLPHRAAHPTG